MTVSFQTTPESTQLTQLISVKTELVISGSDDDDLLTRLIDEASETISQWAGRPLYRAQFRETRFGNRRTRLYLSRYPVASLDATTYSSQTITDVSIDVAETGALYRSVGFSTIYTAGEWSFDYTAGFFLPGEDISGSISVAASDDSYNSSALFHPLLKAGDVILASGFSNGANNGFKKILTATTSKITVDDDLTDENAASRSLAIRTLPGWIERAAIELVSLAYNGRDRDASVESIRIGDASVSFSSKSGDPMDRIRRKIQTLARAA